MADWVGKYKRQLSPKLKVNIGTTEGLGRYTGNGGKSEPVGVVHGQEYVISQPIVRALGGAANVEKLLAQNLQGRGASGFQLGGSPGETLRDVVSTPPDWSKFTNNPMTPMQTDTNLYRQQDTLLGGPSKTLPREPQQITDKFAPIPTKDFWPENQRVVTGAAPTNTMQTQNFGVTVPTGVGFANDPSGYAQANMRPTGVGFANDPSGYAQANMPTGGVKVDKYGYPIYEGTSGTIGLGEPTEEEKAKIREMQAGKVFPTTQPTEPTPEVPAPEAPPDLTPGEVAYRAGLGGLAAYAAGESPQDRRIANLYLGYQRSQNAAERAAYGQQLAQMGLSPEAAAAYGSLLGRQQRSEESQLSGQLAQQAGERAFGATQALGQQGLAAAGFEEGRRQFDENMAFAKERYGDTKEWDDFLRAAEYGDDATVAAAYEKMFGRPMADTAMVTDLRNYAKQARQQQLERGEAAIKMDDLMLDYQSIQNRAAEQNITTTELNNQIAEWGLKQAQESSAGQELINHFIDMASVEGYDWKADSQAIKYLSDFWSTFNDVPFDPANKDHQTWANRYLDIAKATNGSMAVAQFKNSPTYINAPETSTYDADGNIETVGRDVLDGQYIPWLTKISDIGTEVNFVQADDGTVQMTFADGTPVTGDEAVPIVYDAASPKDVNNAITAWVNDSSMMMSDYGVTYNAMQQWLSQHDGKLPVSSTEWEQWSSTDRIYDANNQSDLEDASQTMKARVGIGFDQTQMKKYLTENNGKLPGVESFESWLRTQGDPDRVYQFISGDREDMTAKDQELFKELVANGEIPIIGENAILDQTTQFGETHDGASVRHRPAATHVDMSQKWKDWAASVKGQIITVNGKQYYVSPTNPTAKGEVRGGGTADDDRGKWKEGNTYIEGINVYDIQSGQWVVLTSGASRDVNYFKGNTSWMEIKRS